MKRVVYATPLLLVVTLICAAQSPPGKPLIPSQRRVLVRLCYCFSYSPLLTRFSTVKPAFFASETESGLSLVGELKFEMTRRTGFLQAGQAFSSAALSGRRRVKRPPHAAQLPSHSSYS